MRVTTSGNQLRDAHMHVDADDKLSEGCLPWFFKKAMEYKLGMQ